MNSLRSCLVFIAMVSACCSTILSSDVAIAQSIDSFKRGDQVEVNHFGDWFVGEVESVLGSQVAIVKFSHPNFNTPITSPFSEGNIRQANPEPEFREWKSGNGKFKINAKFKSVEGTDVWLDKKEDGTSIKVAIDKLSTKDKNYLKKLQAKKPADEVDDDDRTQPADEVGSMIDEAMKDIRSATNEHGGGFDNDAALRQMEKMAKDMAADSRKSREAMESRLNDRANANRTNSDRTNETVNSPNTPSRSQNELARVDKTRPERNPRSQPESPWTDDNQQTDSASPQEIVDRKFGFRFLVPAGFESMPINPPNADTLYQFMDREPFPTDRASVIIIQRLHGTIDPNERLSKGEVFRLQGDSVTLEELFWNGKMRDVIRNVEEPGHFGFVSYVMQFPLSGEAVQVVVGGPTERDAQTRRKFNQAVKTFSRSDSNSGGANQSGPALVTSPAQARISRVGLTIILVALGLGGLIFLGVIIGVVILVRK